jgi:hypothetical protein
MLIALHDALALRPDEEGDELGRELGVRRVGRDGLAWLSRLSLAERPFPLRAPSRAWP